MRKDPRAVGLGKKRIRKMKQEGTLSLHQSEAAKARWKKWREAKAQG